MDDRIVTATHDMCREVLTLTVATRDQRPSTKALLAFFTRLANSWDSLCALVRTETGDRHFDSRANDCAVILRCMYDAFLQAAFVARGPDQDALGELYLGYSHIERHLLAKEVLRQENAMAKKIKNSPMRVSAEPRVQAEFEQRKHSYLGNTKKPHGTVRKHWYEGNLCEIARKLGLEDEYVLLCKRFNSSVHSGAFAILDGPAAEHARTIEQVALLCVGRGAGLLVRHTGIGICDHTTQMIEAVEIDLLNAVTGDGS